MGLVTLNASKREDLANTSTKTNRKKGNIPGIFYFRGFPSVPIYVKDTNLNPFIYTSEVNIIALQIEGTAVPYNCILKDIQFDPISDKPIHFDLLGILENEKIKIEVPVKLMGSPVGVKDGGVIQQSIHKVEIECFPKNIPSHIEVNIDHLKIGDGVKVGDLVHPDFDFMVNPDTQLVAVVPPTVEKEAVPAVEGEAVAGEEPAEPEVIGKGKKEEEGEEEVKKEDKKEKKEKEKK